VLKLVTAKLCVKCGKNKPATSKHFYIKPDGKPFSYCRECKTSNYQKWTGENKHYHAKWAKDKRASDPVFREKNNKKSREYHQAHKNEISVRSRAYRKANPDKARDWEFRKNYGIGIEDYNNIYKQQNGLCACCERVPKPGQRLHVDHSHANGEIRGLLCTKCNPGIGFFEENIELLQKAIAYLEKHKAKIHKDNVVQLRRD
jgi:hypothetical protein